MGRWSATKRWAIAICLLALGAGIFWFVLELADPARALAGKSSAQLIYLPVMFRNYTPPALQFCRLGVGAGSDIAAYQVNSLMLGWYLDWGATNWARPGGIKFLPTIRLSQVGGSGYTYSPNGSALLALIDAHLGALWLVGNEPDRRYFQDSVTADIYARAYREIYYVIKGRDPTALVSAGGIVEPTPLRLQYLDLVLQSYQTLYGAAMPVDVWNIHNYILPERNCNYYPDNCWGADVPTGIDVPKGKEYTVDDNGNLTIFKQHVEAFRQWMADRGYQDQPLIITEMGIQMWEDYGFPPARVNAFMNDTFDYLRTMTSAVGYRYDNYRLVQRWAWYSVSDNNFNGWLFDPNTRARTVFGDNFAAYASRLQPVINVTPVEIWAESTGTPPTVTLKALVVNNGNVAATSGTVARFYQGNPSAGGTQIGAAQNVPALDGCAAATTVQVSWGNVTPGTYQIYVVVNSNTYSSSVVLTAPSRKGR
jgi:hypothetical protein